MFVVVLLHRHESDSRRNASRDKEKSWLREAAKKMFTSFCALSKWLGREQKFDGANPVEFLRKRKAPDSACCKNMNYFRYFV